MKQEEAERRLQCIFRPVCRVNDCSRHVTACYSYRRVTARYSVLPPVTRVTACYRRVLDLGEKPLCQAAGSREGAWRLVRLLVSPCHGGTHFCCTFPFFEGCVCTSQHHDRGKSQALRRRKPVLPKIPRPIPHDCCLTSALETQIYSLKPAALRQRDMDVVLHEPPVAIKGILV